MSGELGKLGRGNAAAGSVGSEYERRAVDFAVRDVPAFADDAVGGAGLTAAA